MTRLSRHCVTVRGGRGRRAGVFFIGLGRLYSATGASAYLAGGAWSTSPDYRRGGRGGRLSFEVVVAETDLQILATRDLTLEADAVVARRSRGPRGLHRAPTRGSPSPSCPCPSSRTRPEIVRAMADAAARSGRGADGRGRRCGGRGGRARAGTAQRRGDRRERRRHLSHGDAERIVGAVGGRGRCARRSGLRVPARLLPVAVCDLQRDDRAVDLARRADAATVLAATGRWPTRSRARSATGSTCRGHRGALEAVARGARACSACVVSRGRCMSARGETCDSCRSVH